jgi:condensin complex subunit 2
LKVLENKAISHSLSSFSFSKDAFAFDETTFFRDDSGHQLDDNDDNELGMADAGVGGEFSMDVDNGGPPVEDFFVGEQAVGDDFGGGPGDDMGQDDFGDGEDGPVGPGADQQGPRGAFVGFDPRRAPNERDLVLAMTDADGDGGMMDYFDQNFLKNWAGPEHWKLRKVVRRRALLHSLSLFVIDLNPLVSGSCRNEHSEAETREEGGLQDRLLCCPRERLERDSE